MTTRRSFIHALAALAVLGLSAPALRGAHAAEAGPVVFAAASLKTALDRVNAAYAAGSAVPATISYAASSALAKQIESGAPADLFISADLDWMDALAKGKLIRPDSRIELLGNFIVLIAPKGSARPIEIAPGFGLKALLGEGKLAMANVDAVPAGKYGKAALTHLHVWDAVKGQIAQAENVRAALLLVSRGEAALGIVYKTDAAADAGVEIVGTFPEESHAPIVYPAALTADSTHAAAPAFLAFLKTDEARRIFEAEGFTVLAKD